MSLKNISSLLSTDGSPRILLTHNGETVESLAIVQAAQEHRSFILSTWVKSYESQARRQGLRAEYAKYEPAIAESRWQDSLVVTDPDGYTVHAWVCGRDGQLWHCYVVPELRRIRVATRLIEFACGPLKEYARPWPYSAHARLNPYLLRTK